MRVVTLDDLHQHVLALWGKADGIAWAEPWRMPTAHHDTQTITIHPIVSEAVYATALHEIGHIRLGHPGDDVLADERSAWQWARANALIWTPTMEREAERSLGTYEAGVDKTEYYYEQVKQCTEDLLVGGSPDGLEVCDALVRNAVELAELYEDCGAFGEDEKCAQLLAGASSKNILGAELNDLAKKVGNEPFEHGGACAPSTAPSARPRRRWKNSGRGGEERRKREAQIKWLQSRIGAANDPWIQAQIAKLKNQ